MYGDKTLCQDGTKRHVHEASVVNAAGIKRGFVYAYGKRVYGNIVPDGPGVRFVADPSSKYGVLIQAPQAVTQSV